VSNLFISYAYPETQIARNLQEKMIKAGHRVRVPVGSAVAGNWRTKFTRALAASDVLIAVLGPAGLDSDYVLGEIGAGRVLEQTRGMLLLPVLVGDIPIPGFINDIFCFRCPTGAGGLPDDAALEMLAEQLNKAILDNVRISPRIFISHRHRDKAIAARLIALFERAFKIEPNDIRCTSVPPYMLTPGERTSEQLRSDIAGAELVLGILSPDTSESNYVLCELGASWGRDVSTFPILVRGAGFADVPSPLNERHSISLEKEQDCLQLIEYVTSKTTLHRNEQAGGLSELAVELAAEARAQLNARQDWEHLHSANYTGPVWIKLQTFDTPGPVMHQLHVRWGRLLYAGELSMAPNSFVYLVHDKHRQELAPMRAHVSPPCQLHFGEGNPPEAPSFDIRRGWREVEHPAGS
jgi:hypothetical protein